MRLLCAACVGAAALAALPAHAQVGESVAAKVNDEVITTYDVRQRGKMLLAFSETDQTPEMLALAEEQALRSLIDESGRDIRLEIDGGVGVDNIADIARAGADMFVAGSAIFGSGDYPATIAAMRKALAAV